ncbi:MAG: glycoside hydrolase family 9 protein [Planctomycetota bacterium]
MRFTSLIAILFCVQAIAAAQESGRPIPAFPLKAVEEHSQLHRWKQKPVHRSLVVDDMEQDRGWKGSGIGQLSYTSERAHGGRQAVRFRTSLRDEAYLEKNRNALGSFEGRQGGGTSASLRFAKPQDWTPYNRVSLRVWVDTAMPTSSFCLILIREAAEDNLATPEPVHWVQNLKPGQWNQVLWEVANLKRDRVREFRIHQILRGHEPSDDGMVTYDFDDLELQQVDADVFEGWEPGPGTIAYSHIGYRPGEPKIAVAAPGAGESFEVLDSRGAVVFSGSVEPVHNARGSFGVLDFSLLRQPGSYRLRVGKLETAPFPIGDDIWRGPVIKALNFFYCQRCGHPVQGIHGECHQDWQGVRGDERKVINGGWHDAGDLSQGTWRTGMAVYAMTQLAEAIGARGGDAEMEDRLLDEMSWGLGWLLKTRFGGGHRMSWSMMRIYTDGRIGTVDDVITPSQNVPWENFLTAAVEVRCWRLLKQSDPELAQKALAAAREDWQWAVDSRDHWTEADLREAAWGAAASAELFEATSDALYREHAKQFGRLLLECQERQIRDNLPYTGYFCTDTGRRRIANYDHAAFREAPLVALETLCRALPDDVDWIDWYAAAAIHAAGFLEPMCEVTAPYHLLPAGIWQRSSLNRVGDAEQRAEMLTQLEDGTRLNDEHYLRVFPVWSRLRGSTAVQLSGTWALAAATRLRGDLRGQHLVNRQLEWVFGTNPFTQSLMYGEGHNFSSLFAYCLKDVVGALPVGIDCMEGDRPYWASNYATYKEIWVEPVSRFLGTVAACGLPALIEGRARQGVDRISFRASASGIQHTATTSDDGSFSIQLPGGDWQVNAGGGQWRLKTVTGGWYRLELDPAQDIIFDLKRTEGGVELAARGRGSHTFALRGFNCRIAEPSRRVELKPGQPLTLRWPVEVLDRQTPWVVVATVRGAPAWRQELIVLPPGLAGSGQSR